MSVLADWRYRCSDLYWKTSADEWRRVLDVDVLGTVKTMGAFVPGKRDRGWGRVVYVASLAGEVGAPTGPSTAHRARPSWVDHVSPARCWR